MVLLFALYRFSWCLVGPAPKLSTVTSLRSQGKISSLIQCCSREAVVYDGVSVGSLGYYDCIVEGWSGRPLCVYHIHTQCSVYFT